MAEGEDGQEKTLDPSPQRLQKAREQGDVPSSMDVNTAAAYLGLLLAILLFAEDMARDVGAPLMAFIGAPELIAEQLLGPGGASLAAHFLGGAVIGAAPIILLPAALVLVAMLAQQSIIFAPVRAAPKLSNIDPIKTAGQKFGVTGLFEFMKSFLKLACIGAILAAVITFNFDGVTQTMMLPATALPHLMMEYAIMLLIPTLVLATAIGAADYFWQQAQHIKKLRMSHQELKEETKDSDGDPQMKATRRQRAREIAMARMMEEVPKADVIIVNPTHYAVALKWNRAPGAAPTCVAKGVDEIAARIREIATENGVPIHSDPPTARALHGTVDIGDEIKVEHYQAVAVAIRFAEEARRKRAQGYQPGGAAR